MTLSPPDHLRANRDRLPHGAAGVIALVLGIAAFVVVAVAQDHLWSIPDWRISLPGFAAAAVAAIASIARRERTYPLALLGLGLAAAASVLGWFLMLAIVIAAIAALILILHSLM